MNFTKTLTELVNRVLNGRTEVLYRRIPVTIADTDTQVVVLKNDYIPGYSLYFHTPMTEAEYLAWKPF